MSIYTRPGSPYYWMRFPLDPASKRPVAPPRSTRVLWNGPTKAQRKQLADTAALVYAQALLAITRQEFDPEPPPAPVDVPTLRVWAKEFTATHMVDHRGADEEASIIRVLLTRFAGTPDCLGDQSLTALTPALLARWSARRLRDDRVKASTCNRNVDQLKLMLTKAVPTYLPANPLTGEHGIEPLETATFHARYFTRAEFDAFIAAIKATTHIQGTPRAEGLVLAYAAIGTLLRRGSLLRLTWPDYHGNHFVPLDAKVRIDYSPVTTEMRRYLDQLTPTPHIPYILASHWQVGHVHTVGSAGDHLDTWFRDVCDRANIRHSRKDRGVTFHSFRHTGATWAMQQGGNVKTVMALGGWKDERLFIRTYCHTDTKAVSATAQGLLAEAR